MMMKIGIRGFNICFTLDNGVLIASSIKNNTRARTKFIMGDRKTNAVIVTIRNPKALVRTSRAWTKLFEG
jgi:hypothetical protein